MYSRPSVFCYTVESQGYIACPASMETITGSNKRAGFVLHLSLSLSFSLLLFGIKSL